MDKEKINFVIKLIFAEIIIPIIIMSILIIAVLKYK